MQRKRQERKWLIIVGVLIVGWYLFQEYQKRPETEETFTPTGPHSISVADLQETQDFYTWTEDRIPMVSAHRGGPYPGYPENSIEAFAHVLEYTPSIIELDVAMTRDSVLVLLHDDTLDRTTTGKGRIDETSFAEVQDLFLVDEEGTVTDFKVPTLKEALIWSKGKALLTVDIKRSVPVEKVVEEVRETGAEAHAALITYSFPAARKLHRMAPELMLSVSMGNRGDMQRLEETGIPWERVIAFTGVSERDKAFNKALHDKGVFTILGVIGNLDRRAVAKGDHIYANFVQNGADILATDRPIEAAKILKGQIPENSSKEKYFN